MVIHRVIIQWLDEKYWNSVNKCLDRDPYDTTDYWADLSDINNTPALQVFIDAEKIDLLERDEADFVVVRFCEF